MRRLPRSARGRQRAAQLASSSVQLGKRGWGRAGVCIGWSGLHACLEQRMQVQQAGGGMHRVPGEWAGPCDPWRPPAANALPDHRPPVPCRVLLAMPDRSRHATLFSRLCCVVFSAKHRPIQHPSPCPRQQFCRLTQLGARLSHPCASSSSGNWATRLTESESFLVHRSSCLFGPVLRSRECRC